MGEKRVSHSAHGTLLVGHIQPCDIPRSPTALHFENIRVLEVEHRRPRAPVPGAGQLDLGNARLADSLDELHSGAPSIHADGARGARSLQPPRMDTPLGKRRGGRDRRFRRELGGNRRSCETDGAAVQRPSDVFAAHSRRPTSHCRAGRPSPAGGAGRAHDCGRLDADHGARTRKLCSGTRKLQVVLAPGQPRRRDGSGRRPRATRFSALRLRRGTEPFL